MIPRKGPGYLRAGQGLRCGGMLMPLLLTAAVNALLALLCVFAARARYVPSCAVRCMWCTYRCLVYTYITLTYTRTSYLPTCLASSIR